MDGSFYLDSREPFFLSTEYASVSLATTDKALHTAIVMPTFGSQYFGRRHKGAWIKAFGRMTTAATPGNLTIDVYWGSGADATGTILAASQAATLVASQTSLAWWLDCFVTCEATGSTTTAGSLFCWGAFNCHPSVIAGGNQPVIFPASTPAAVGSLDLTGTNTISIQAKRSGSTAETMQVHFLRAVSLG
jgi:hypothetical protein